MSKKAEVKEGVIVFVVFALFGALVALAWRNKDAPTIRELVQACADRGGQPIVVSRRYGQDDFYCAEKRGAK